MNQKAIATQIGVQEAKVQQAEAVLALKQKQKDALTVRAGIDGVLEAPDVVLQSGQHVAPGTMLAKVVQPDQLKAALKIAETQARDIQIGQPAEVDTHNGVIEGKVMRIDLAVVNGTVTVDVELAGALPLGAAARPECGWNDRSGPDGGRAAGRPAGVWKREQHDQPFPAGRRWQDCGSGSGEGWPSFGEQYSGS